MVSLILGGKNVLRKEIAFWNSRSFDGLKCVFREPWWWRV